MRTGGKEGRGHFRGLKKRISKHYPQKERTRRGLRIYFLKKGNREISSPKEGAHSFRFQGKEKGAREGARGKAPYGKGKEKEPEIFERNYLVPGKIPTHYPQEERKGKSRIRRTTQGSLRGKREKISSLVTYDRKRGERSLQLISNKRKRQGREVTEKN